MKKRLLFLIILCFNLGIKSQTVGLKQYEVGAQDGYVLFGPFSSQNVYLIDNCGRLVHKWETDFKPAAATVFLGNGHLLKTASSGPPANPTFAFGGGGEHIQEIDWDGNVVWEFTYSDSTHRMHHDFVQLPNGNLLIPAWELKTKAEAIQAGRDTTLIPDGVLWAEFIIEVDRENGEIVWEWHFWDHLIQDYDATKDNYGVIAEHPELLDINRTGGPTAAGNKNWLHINSIDYNPMMDQILINSFFISELFIIDHSTTTAEAATHSGGNSTKGGDLLYRWGNPQNYDHGTADNRTVFGSHNAHWIKEGLADAGKIMFFNNGNGRPGGSHSSIDIIAPPVDSYDTGQYIYNAGVAYGPTATEWTYEADPPEGFYSNFLSGAQRLPNGNTLICSGAKGRFFEINPEKEIVWEYVNPVAGGGIISQGDTIPIINGKYANIVFRCTRYTTDFPGLAGVDLTPGDPVELDFTQPYDCQILATTPKELDNQVRVFPNPAGNFIRVEYPEHLVGYLRVYNALGQLVKSSELTGQTAQKIDVTNLRRGVYFLDFGGKLVRKVIITR